MFDVVSERLSETENQRENNFFSSSQRCHHQIAFIIPAKVRDFDSPTKWEISVLLKKELHVFLQVFPLEGWKI